MQRARMHEVRLRVVILLVHQPMDGEHTKVWRAEPNVKGVRGGEGTI